MRILVPILALASGCIEPSVGLDDDHDFRAQEAAWDPQEGTEDDQECIPEDEVGDDQTSAVECIMNNGCSGQCGDYSSIGQCWCDDSCDTYGDCCMDKHQQCG